MFDLSWTELLVIGVVALIAIGPKELPGVLRMVGQWMGKVRRMASEFQGQFQDAMREAEMADIKKEVDDLAGTAQTYTNFDPLADINKSFETAIDDKPADGSTASETVSDTPVATAPPAPDAAAPAEPVVAQDNVVDTAHTASVVEPAAEPAAAPEAPVKAGSGA
jgi:sec-independent protein translocase protein TatB